LHEKKNRQKKWEYPLSIFLLKIIFICSNLNHLFIGVTDQKPNVKTNALDDEIHETINANKSVIVDD
jgi:hypothetical protein